MTLPTYNPDKKYELMAAMLPGPNQNMPDAESVVDDLREILKICYTFTTMVDTPRELTAAELANAIVSYLFSAWSTEDQDFERYAKEFWHPSKDVTGNSVD
jgi:hypothetical protein